MFNYKQDVGLLHCALMSVQRIENSNLCGHDDYKTSVEIVSNTVKKILNLYTYDINDEKEIIKIHHHINERLHAALFFHILRKQSITSADATEHYNSIYFNWPEMDFKFYIELNYGSKWSEYFIKCALQLPSKVYYSLVEELLSRQFPAYVNSYLLHMILQSVILKLLEVSYDFENECIFAFDFTNIPGFENKDSIPSVEEIHFILFEKVCEKIKQSNDTDSIKIVLHALKTFMRHSKDKKSLSAPFSKMCKLLIDMCKVTTNEHILKTAVNNCSDSFANFSYFTSSWDISECYLIFILKSYQSNFDLAVKDDLPSESGHDMKETTNEYLPEVFHCLNSIFEETFDLCNIKHFEMVLKIIQLDFEGASFAVENLLSNPSLLTIEAAVKTLEENSKHIDLMNIYPIMLKSLKAVESQEVKIKLLKLFYETLSTNSVKNYNEILQHILSLYGFTDEFQLPDFDSQLLLSVQETLTLKEAGEVLPPLFLQSPKAALKHVIEQVLIQGSEGESLIEALKLVPVACSYTKTDKDVPPLIEILRECFEKTLEAYEMENMIPLCKFLMQVQSNTSILSISVFLEKCIFPYIHCYDKIPLILNCLNVSLEILISNKAFDIAIDTFETLISFLAQLINNCIENHNGEMKDLALSVLNVLEKYQKETRCLKDDEKTNLGKTICLLNEAVHVYAVEFLHDFPELLHHSSLWIWCLKTKNIAFFEDKMCDHTITYSALVDILTKLLPHFTKEEWNFSTSLIKVCCKSLALKKQIIESSGHTFMLSDCEKDLYAVVSCFISSLYFILSENSTKHLIYISTCFSNCLMKLLNEEESLKPEVLFIIFLDISHLIHRISHHDLQKSITVFTAMVIELKKLIVSSCAGIEHLECEYQKLMSQAIKCLPDSSEKNTLLQNISTK